MLLYGLAEFSEQKLFIMSILYVVHIYSSIMYTYTAYFYYFILNKVYVQYVLLYHDTYVLGVIFNTVVQCVLNTQ